MKVEIRNYHPSNGGNGYLNETWSLDSNRRAVCDDPSVQEDAEREGIRSGGCHYYPRDGEAFLRQLPYEFANSSFTRAIVIE